MTTRILVIGATGLLGDSVARSLQEAGFGVRVMSRSIGRVRSRFPEPFEVVEGDALDRSTLLKAMEKCDAVHVSIEHDREDECVTQIVAAAQAQRLSRITFVSGTSVCEENRWFPLIERKLKAEQTIMSSGIGYTIYYPSWFYEMLAKFVRHGRGILFGWPSQRWHYLSGQEFARMVTEGYRRPEALNKQFHIHGPQALTTPEALRQYCRVLHPQIRRFLHLPYWFARLLGRLTRNEELKAGVSMVGYLEKVGERGDPTEANAILGAPQITLEQWLQARRTTVTG